MPQPIRLLRLGNTTVDLDLTFFFLVALFIFNALDGKEPAKAALLWVPVLLISLVTHELAHAAAIKGLGFGGSRIFLTGWGGVTINERRARPWQDLIISVVGPLSSFLLAGAAYLALPLSAGNPFWAALLNKLSFINVYWGIINMLPIVPLDGGAAVRHLLRAFLSEVKAFKISAVSSLVIGGALLALALFRGEIWLAVMLGAMLQQVWQQWKIVRQWKPPQ